MAIYKVIQDIEAEDKLLGPLTMRQFIYASIVAIMGFIAFKLTAISPFLVIPFLPPMVFFGMLAAPFGHDQPSEVWMLARIRFFLKPRRRIWNQDGVQELVTITVPKKIEKHLTNGLNQYEVKSRLQALASTLDSRGWAVKNTSVNLFSEPSYVTADSTNSDRLISAGSLPQEVPNYEVYATDDIMDEHSNPTAQHLSTMINQSDQAHRQAVAASIHTNAGDTSASEPPADYWFMNQPDQQTVGPPGFATFSTNPVVFPGMDGNQVSSDNTPSEAEEKLLKKIHAEKVHDQVSHGHLKTLQPLSAQSQPADDNQAQAVSVTARADDKPTTAPPDPDDQGQAAGGQSPNPAILRLANNDDLNVATLAREAEKANPQPFDDEVVISLH